MYTHDLKIKILEIIESKKFTNKEIINMFKISKHTFYKIKNDKKILRSDKYPHLGIRKRKTKITRSMKNFIIKYVTTKINFDYEKLISIMHKKYNKSISRASIYRILEKNKITNKKICNKQILTTPEKRNIQIKLFKEQIKNALHDSSMENIISIDETSIDSHICNNYGWSKKGKMIVNTIKNPKIRYSLILDINCNKIIHKKIIKGSVNGETFLEFIKDLVKKLQTNNNSYILLDNARIHHYKKLKDFIKTKPKIKLIYNIPYTPETNPIEHVFNDIKKKLKDKKVNNDNLIDEIKKSLNDVNNNNNFKAYYDKSLIDRIKKLK